MTADIKGDIYEGLLQKEDAADLPTPDVLVAEITENLEAALAQFQSIQNELDDNE